MSAAATKSTPIQPTPSRHPAYDSPSPPHPSTADLTSEHHPDRGHPKQAHSRKRPRRATRSTMAALERASSSSDSVSSHSGMADNETEPEHALPPSSEGTAPQTTAPAKKKRTRTLTTPHQSAVLHALLAKSRFPTTAMREEVGRQIGLSARKVQIWFQNQRQKARRPQGETAPLSRPPPQFGPFPIMTPGPSAPPPSATPHSGHSSARAAMYESGGSVDSNPALSGPGISGQPSSSSSSSHPPRAPSSTDEWDLPRGMPASPLHTLTHPPRSSKGMATRDVLAGPRAPAPVDVSPQFSRVLPPINVNLGALRPRSSTDSHASATSTSSFPPLTPAMRSSVTIVQRHDASTPRSAAASPSGSPGALGIPPPFALQPQPQWDPHAFTPYTRPEFASWSHTSGSSRSRVHVHASPDTSRSRPVYAPSSGDPSRGAPRDHPLSPSRSRGLSCRAVASGHRSSTRSDDEV